MENKGKTGKLSKQSLESATNVFPMIKFLNVTLKLKRKARKKS